ncbi:MAG: acetyl-CoA carboxylase biotin carboxyl carrier protein subunit, partial [Actinomycetota bacterium]
MVDDRTTITSPLQGTIVSLYVEVGSMVRAGGVVALIESMKMHHEIVAPTDGRVVEVATDVGATLMIGDPVAAVGAVGSSATASVALGEGSTTLPDGDDTLPPPTGELRRPDLPPRELDRPDLADVVARHALGLDDARPDAVAKRRRRGRRTARENVADLVDDGTFVEYGPTVIAAQRRRR